jgi:hypothetical protein
MSNNVFEILKLPRYECWNDRILAWLCDPRGGHEVPDFAATIIRHLWGGEFHQAVTLVESQPTLGPECRSDLAVHFDGSLLVIENKVAQSALRGGQVRQQFDLAKAKGKPFFYVLLYPDRVGIASHQIQAPEFKGLSYSALAMVLDQAAGSSTDRSAQMIIQQFSEYVRSAYASAAPPSVRKRRSPPRAGSRSQSWDRAAFLESIDKADPELRAAQENLLEALQEVEAVETDLDRGGRTARNPTYHVYVTGVGEGLLRVGSDGDMYAYWKPLGLSKRSDVAQFYRDELHSLLASSRPTDSSGGHLKHDLIRSMARVDELVEILQRVSDRLAEEEIS